MNPIFIEAMPRWSGFIFSAFEKRSQPTHQSVASDKTHRKPSDEATIIATYCFWHLTMMPALEEGS